MTEAKTLDLFGGDRLWKSSDWTASDDRVRGGKSQSHLYPNAVARSAAFAGILDIKALGGAGFASQRTVGDDKSWDLAGYDGIEIMAVSGDTMRYTFNVKDTLLPADPDSGREQSTISYEYDFTLPSDQPPGAETAIWIAWSDLKATYRGKEKADAPKLQMGAVKRFGIMCRSFFGEQKGPFELVIRKIIAIKHDDKEDMGMAVERVEDVEKHERNRNPQRSMSKNDLERGVRTDNKKPIALA